MRIGILIGACGLAVAAATQADITSTTTVAVNNNVEDRSVDALHRAIGAPGSMQRDEVVRDLKKRVERGEISPFKVLLSDALPDYKFAGVGEFGPNRTLGGALSINASSRGVMTASFDDNFDSYPMADDPIFGRFAVNMQDQINPSGEPWDFSQSWYIPSLFVDGQMDPDKVGVADPLPRWQGAAVIEDDGAGTLTADINGDGVVDTSDLGILVGSFGAMGVNAADINGDMVVDTSDLGILIGQFLQTSGPFCLYTVDVAQTTDPDGFPLDGGTIAAGPVATDTIAILNTGALSNDVDANADGCPDCDFFNIETMAAVGGEVVYGDWTLDDDDADGAAAAAATFKGTLDTVDCVGWGDNAVLADARGETDIIENQCCFLGARTTFPLFAPTASNTLISDVDCYFTTLDTFQWVDTTSSVEGFTVTRTFLGGYAPSLSADFLKFSTGGDGFLNHFVFLGNLPGVFTIGQFYGTAPDPLVGNAGIEIKTGEWFTLSYRLDPSEVSIWLKDSETMALADPMPGDDGSGTPLDGSDDIEDGFAKIFPTGPFGASPGVDDGQVPDIPQGPLAAVSMDTMRFLWSGDPTALEVPGYEPHNIFYDNIHVEGTLFPVPDLPAFKLKYVDDIETYFAGGNLALMGGRWFDAQSSRAIIDDFTSASGDNSIFQDNPFGDGMFRNEFETDLPLAIATVDNGWTASVKVAFANTTVVRSIRLGDDVVSQDPTTATVARLLSGVQNENGIVIVEMDGSSRIHMRVPNPGFDELSEASPVDVDEVTDLGDSPNPRFINVPTTARTEASEVNSFIEFSFEVDSDQNLVVRKAGVVVAPQNDAGQAIAVGYEDPMNPGTLANGGGWVSTSVAVDEMSFESGNQIGGAFVALNVDDVCLDGFGPVIAAGPAFELPYTDDFEEYPNNTPIAGQGDTPFVDGASIVDTNLCIEQGLQALDESASDLDDWCEYMIKSDAIGGINPVNDWGLSDGDLIWVRQADLGGAVDCKELYCFTNPNRPDEFFPNVGLFDPAEMPTKEAVGARVEFVALRAGFNPPDTVGVVDTFDWNTYDPTNLFGKYVVNSIDDADDELGGQQDIATASLASNQDYYDGVGGKIGIGSTIAVDQLFATDDETGLTTSPGVIDVENLFKIVDPCEVEILTGTWTYVGDGAGVDDAQPLAASDVPHFNFVFDGFPRYTGGGINVVDSPAGVGFGQVLKAINLSGVTDEGGSLFIDLRSTFPPAFGIVGTDCVFEVDCYVTDNKSRYTIQLDGPNGAITDIGLGGPDKDLENSPGELEVPATNFSLEENNPSAGGPFGMGPDTWFYDTGVAIPLNAWFRLRATVTSTGSYTIAMDASGVAGGDGTFETAIDTGSGDEVNGASGQAGVPLTVGANSISGFDTNAGFDQGGTGTFLRDPITIQEDATLPGGNTFPDDFCFYLVDDIDGIVLGNPPAPCNGIFGLNSVLGVLRNAGLPNWPDGGNVDICPESQGFIWNEIAMAGTPCTGEWTWIDPDDEGTLSDFPDMTSDVASWATYDTIPAFSSPGEPSTWYFDNISLSGSDTE